jgi:hypothetical protein
MPLLLHLFADQKYKNHSGLEAQFKYILFSIRALLRQNLCFVCGENPPVSFNLKCANTFKEENHSCSRLCCRNIIYSLHSGIVYYKTNHEASKLLLVH